MTYRLGSLKSDYYQESPEEDVVWTLSNVHIYNIESMHYKDQIKQYTDSDVVLICRTFTHKKTGLHKIYDFTFGFQIDRLHTNDWANMVVAGPVATIPRKL